MVGNTEIPVHTLAADLQIRLECDTVSRLTLVQGFVDLTKVLNQYIHTSTGSIWPEYMAPKLHSTNAPGMVKLPVLPLLVKDLVEHHPLVI